MKRNYFVVFGKNNLIDEAKKKTEEAIKNASKVNINPNDLPVELPIDPKLVNKITGGQL